MRHEVFRTCVERLRNHESSMRVGVLMGGASAEREISLKTGLSICESLRRCRYTVVPIDVDAMLPQQLRMKKISVAFLALHGVGGEDGTVQGLVGGDEDSLYGFRGLCECRMYG